MKTGRAPGPSEVSLELIVASRDVGIQVMAEICQISRWSRTGLECWCLNF